MLAGRASGVLLHPTSLPGERHRRPRRGAPAASWTGCSARGQSFWQILPLVAVDEGGSPYNGLSAMAGNPLLVDLRGARARRAAGARATLGARPALAPTAWTSPRVVALEGGAPGARLPRLARRRRAPACTRALAAFRAEHAAWLDDYAPLPRAAARATAARAWTDWAPALRDREPAALAAARGRAGATRSSGARFAQFLFDRQWARAARRTPTRAACASSATCPIFVAHDSADVWAHRELFQPRRRRAGPRWSPACRPTTSARRGQRWGNPLYRWDAMARARLRLVDSALPPYAGVGGPGADRPLPRLRGVLGDPGQRGDRARTGAGGPGPGAGPLPRGARRGWATLPLIAEDLGLITARGGGAPRRAGLPGDAGAAVRLRRRPREPAPAGELPGELGGLHGHARQRHDAGLVAQRLRGRAAQVRPRRSRRRRRPVPWALIEAVFRSPRPPRRRAPPGRARAGQRGAHEHPGHGGRELVLAVPGGRRSPRRRARACASATRRGGRLPTGAAA